MFNFIPITFYIEINPQKPNGQLLNAIHSFENFYNVLETNKELIKEAHTNFQQIPTIIAKITNSKIEKSPARLLPVTYDKRNSPQYTRYTMPLCHFSGHNIWLLKPTCLNRGRGIHVFHDVESLKNLISNDCEDGLCINTFIIQKYIESPLLIKGRKFDIRMWVLVTHEFDCYLFKEGYLRTSSSQFSIDPNNIDNKFVHLTNNAVQKYSEGYGSFEDGNQMSFKDFAEYLSQENPEKNRFEEIIIQIKSQIKKSYLAVRKKLNTDSKKGAMEIFGYDFIIDSDLNVWLIEVNTNPCIEESSDLLKMLLPRMINDAFKLTIDSVFPPLFQYVTSPLKKYTVTGYSDSLNMW